MPEFQSNDARSAMTEQRLKRWTQGREPIGSPSLWHVITHAVERAQDQGLGEAQQYNRAVHAVMRVEPSLTLLSAARLVNAHLETVDPLGLLARYTSTVARGTKPLDEAAPP
ncbi:hypothetical protein A6A04_06675 [Paramagnetospirillum marisnigri]|uniref:Uncharacterized protein n=1 Tax=Paramagnetospirillum marisnigri TaxID=1285242 RepID=A0A178MBP8_9PROT|nr:hypothetical protein [Paramagnetospirillum marisnigri]OAN45577.1 hypothetical protein A6A04_06675 [Paramagnetospirillum marisnigri]